MEDIKNKGMYFIELNEMQKAMIGRGVSYEISELVLHDFVLRMKQFEEMGIKTTTN